MQPRALIAPGVAAARLAVTPSFADDMTDAAYLAHDVDNYALAAALKSIRKRARRRSRRFPAPPPKTASWETPAMF